MLATVNTGKIGRGFGKHAGEWTGRVDIRKKSLAISVKQTGNVRNLSIAGRSRVTEALEDKLIASYAKRHRFKIVRQIRGGITSINWPCFEVDY